MLAIKLQRIGKKHQPSYRVVVAVGRSKMAAPPVEDLGSYSPKTKVATLKNERATYWLGVGAQPTMTVYNLFVKHGIVTTPKRAIKMKKPVVAAAAPETPAAVIAPAASVAVEEPKAAPVEEVAMVPEVTIVPEPEPIAAVPEPEMPAVQPMAAEEGSSEMKIELTEIKG